MITPLSYARINHHYLSLYILLVLTPLSPLQHSPPQLHKLEFGPVSEMSADHFDVDFEFPTTVSNFSTNIALPSDVVFCGKVLVPRTKPGSDTKNPFLIRSGSFRKPSSARFNGFTSGQDKRPDKLRSSSTGESRYQKSSSGLKRYNGLFGMLQFPVQMELSDIKKRQARKDPLPLPLPQPSELPVDGDGKLLPAGAGKGSWDLIRPLRRRNHLMRALAKASRGCIPLV